MAEPTPPKSVFPVANHTVSFWRENPHELDNFQSSEAAPAECDIAIIGAGLAGVSTAYHLLTGAEPRPRVAIFEAREACSGATGRNGGHTKASPVLMMQREDKWGAQVVGEVAALQDAQIRAIQATVEKEGIDCDFFLTRSYDVLFDADHAAAAKAWLAERRAEDRPYLRDVQWLDGPNLERILGIRGAKGATSCPAASLWPYKLVMGLLARCIQLGAQVHTHTPVRSLSTSGSAGATLLHTSRGDCAARRVVHATNGYATSLLPDYRPAITPIRGSACHIVADGAAAPPHLPCTYNLRYDPDNADYMVPRPDGSIVLGGAGLTFKHDLSTWHDTVDDAGSIDSVRAHFDGVLQRMRGWDGPGVRIDRIWTGIMGSTFDEMPHVGAVPGTQNQWMLAGFNGGGMSMIFTTARAIARMITEGAAFADIGLPACFETSEDRMLSRVNWSHGKLVKDDEVKSSQA